MSERRPCHAWMPPGERKQTCALCGATCTRGPKGDIELFDRAPALPAIPVAVVPSE